MSITNGYNYLMEFGSDTAVCDFTRIAFTEHCDVIFVSKALNVRSRNSLGDRLVPELHWLDRKPRVILFGVHYSERVHFRPESDELDDRMALALFLQIADLSGVDHTVKTG